MAERKGRKPDFTGDGIAVWINTDRNGNEYLSVQLFGRDTREGWRAWGDEIEV